MGSSTLWNSFLVKMNRMKHNNGLGARFLVNCLDTVEAVGGGHLKEMILIPSY